MLSDPSSRAMPVGRTIARGFAAAHHALVGALYLFLLQAPVQVLGAVAYAFQGKTLAGPEEGPDPGWLMLSLAVSCGSLLFALAVFFLFPLVQGGMLGRVRDRLESPRQPPGPFGAYGRAFYVRLLGSQGLFALALIVIMVPVMGLGVGLAFQEIAKAMPDVPADGAPAPQLPDSQQLTRLLLSNPTMLICMVIASVLASAVGMVYWVAGSIIVSEQGLVMASWRKALHFCRQNISAVLVVWFLAFAVGALVSPLGMVGQLGIVKELWALVALALLYSALLGYSGVLMAGLIMSLYLARRPLSGQSEPRLSQVA